MSIPPCRPAVPLSHPNCPNRTHSVPRQYKQTVCPVCSYLRLTQLCFHLLHTVLTEFTGYPGSTSSLPYVFLPPRHPAVLPSPPPHGAGSCFSPVAAEWLPVVSHLPPLSSWTAHMQQCDWFFLFRLPAKTTRANHKTIHICLTHTISLRSPPLHKQPKQLFGLLHAALQQNNCTNSSFPIIL